MPIIAQARAFRDQAIAQPSWGQESGAQRPVMFESDLACSNPIGLEQAAFDRRAP